MEDDKVKRLPVRFKQPLGDKVLNIVHGHKCLHGRFLIDEKLDAVECGLCHERLSPMWVLKHLAAHETQWHEASRTYQEEMKRLDERSRTKCQHCGQITRISRH